MWNFEAETNWQRCVLSHDLKILNSLGDLKTDRREFRVSWTFTENITCINTSRRLFIFIGRICVSNVTAFHFYEIRYRRRLTACRRRCFNWISSHRTRPVGSIFGWLMTTRGKGAWKRQMRDEKWARGEPPTVVRTRELNARHVQTISRHVLNIVRDTTRTHAQSSEYWSRRISR